ncbi:hypothetical protein KQH26_00670 [bacterium]|nr:hypothetical protein [bacterium]
MFAEKKPYNKPIIENLLLISGSGRNCGKTTLACKIIANITKTTTVYALKISPHFHQMSEKQELLLKQKDYSIFRETDMNATKDSSRMLKAGARESLYLQCEDYVVQEAFQQLLNFIPEDTSVVCESGSLAKAIQPGLHLFLGNGNKNSKHQESADRLVHFNGEVFDLNIDQVEFDVNTWKLL